MPGHGVDVATRDRSGERVGGAERGSTLSTRGAHERQERLGRARRPRRRRARLPERAPRGGCSRWYAAAWYAARCAGATRNGRMPSDTASRSTVGGPVDRAPRAGKPRRPRPRPTATTAAGGARRSRTSGRSSSQLVELVERAGAGEVHDQRAGLEARAPARPRCRRWRRRAWRRPPGRRRARRRRRRRASAPRRRRGAAVDAASRASAGDRRRPSSRARPAPTASVGAGATRDPRGRTPAGACAVQRCTSSFQPLVGVPDYSGTPQR